MRYEFISMYFRYITNRTNQIQASHHTYGALFSETLTVPVALVAARIFTMLAELDKDKMSGRALGPEMMALLFNACSET